jgi:hypothetical protein
MPISGTRTRQAHQTDLSDRAWAIFFCLKSTTSYFRQEITPTDIISDTAHDTAHRHTHAMVSERTATDHATEYHARTVPVQP